MRFEFSRLYLNSILTDELDIDRIGRVPIYPKAKQGFGAGKIIFQNGPLTSAEIALLNIEWEISVVYSDFHDTTIKRVHRKLKINLNDYSINSDALIINDDIGI